MHQFVTTQTTFDTSCYEIQRHPMAKIANITYIHGYHVHKLLNIAIQSIHLETQQHR